MKSRPKNWVWSTRYKAGAKWMKNKDSTFDPYAMDSFKRVNDRFRNVITKVNFRNENMCRQHQCWWQMLETKCVNDNFEILVTVLPFLSPTFSIFIRSVGHQHSKNVSNIEILSPTPENYDWLVKSPTTTCHQHLYSWLSIAKVDQNEGFLWCASSL